MLQSVTDLCFLQECEQRQEEDFVAVHDARAATLTAATPQPQIHFATATTHVPLLPVLASLQVDC